MKRLSAILTLVILCAFSCEEGVESPSVKHDQKAVEYLDQALSKSGTMKGWQELEKLSFVKKTRMFLPDSSIEMESLVRQTYSNSPEFRGEIEYLEDSLQRRIVQEGNEVRYFELGKEVYDSVKISKASKNIQTQFYVIGLPYKLKDKGPIIAHLDQEEIERHGLVNRLYIQQRVSEGNAKDEDWWIYFDPETDHMVGYLIQHDGRYSYILNDSSTVINDFPFPISRRSLAMDMNKENTYLRADYVYSEIEIR